MDGSDPRAAPRPNRRRETSDLYATILEVVKRHRGEARITRVSYGAGMPVDRLKVAVDRLVELGLLQRKKIDGYAVFEVTARGQEFLTTYWKMRGFIALFDAPEQRLI